MPTFSSYRLMLLLTLLSLKTFKFDGAPEIFLYRNQTVTYRNGTIKPQIKCRSPQKLCNMYQNLACNCTYDDRPPYGKLWLCSGIDLNYRHSLYNFSFRCEEVEPGLYIEGSCRVSLSIDSDAVYSSNFYSMWYYIIIAFLVLVVLLAVVFIVVWIIPDFSIVEPTRQQKRD